jgi:trigger factor
LNSSVEKLEGNRVRITVTHTADEVAGAISEAYTTIARKIKLPGFRPGKAPRPIIDTHVGRDSVLGEALEELVERSYPQALDELDIRPIERPDTGELDGLEEGEGHTYTAEVEVRPVLTLSSIADLKVSVPPTATSDEEIEAQIDQLRDRFATLEVVEGRGIEMGDFALLSFAGEVDGKTAEDLSVDKYLYEFGRGIMPEGFDEGLIGSVPGEARVIELIVPDNAANPDYAGKQGVFKVEVMEIKAKTLPAVDDDFAAGVGFETAQELRDDMRRRIESNKAAGRVRGIERAARELVADRLVGEIPQPLIDSRKETMYDEFVESIGKQGFSVADYVEQTGLSEQELDFDMLTEATSRLREEFGLEALFRAAGLEFAEGELDGEIAAIAAEEKVNPTAMRKRLVESGVMPLIREQLMRRHAIRYLIDTVEVTEAEPEDLIAKLAEAEAAKFAPAEKPKKKAAAKKPAAKKDDSKKEE